MHLVRSTKTFQMDLARCVRETYARTLHAPMASEFIALRGISRVCFSRKVWKRTGIAMHRTQNFVDLPYPKNGLIHRVNELAPTASFMTTCNQQMIWGDA